MTRLRRLTAALALSALGLLLGLGEARAQSCVTAETVGVGGGFATIQSAVNFLGGSLTNDTCIEIIDSATYPEQVTVQGIANNNFQLHIFATSGNNPTVSPPASSTAAFVIANASVSVQGIKIVVGKEIPYGIDASSAFVSISSVNISTSGGLGIYGAGVALGSWSSITLSTVVVAGADALLLNGSSATKVSQSYFQTDGGFASLVGYSASGVDLQNASSNTFTAVVSSSTVGQALWLATGSNRNVVTASTMATVGGSAVVVSGSTNSLSGIQFLGGGSGGGGLDVNGGSSNTITTSTFSAMSGWAVRFFGSASSNTLTQSLISNQGGGVYFTGGSYGNTVSFSSVNVKNTAADFDIGASSNLITQSYFYSSTFFAADFYNASANTVSLSTFAASWTGTAVQFQAAPSTITQCMIYGNNTGLTILSGSDGAVISRSTITANSAGISNGSSGITIAQSYVTPIAALGGSSNVVTGSYFFGGGGIALDLTGSRSVVSGSTATTSATPGPAIHVSGSSNTITGGFFVNYGGYALKLDGGASENTISLTTATTYQTGYIAAYAGSVSSNVFDQCSFSAPTGFALEFDNNANGNTVSRSTMTSGASAAVQFLGASTNTVTQSFISNSGSNALILNLGSNSNVIDRSTVTTGTTVPAIYVNVSSGVSITNSYVQSNSTAVFIQSSTDTNLNGDTIMVALGGSSGNGIGVVSGSNGLHVTQTTFLPGLGTGYVDGIYSDGSNTGVFDISTNTIGAGPINGISIGGMGPGSTLWIASNTIVYPMGTSDGTGNSRGIYVTGPIPSATIRGNSVYGRGSAVATAIRNGIVVSGVPGVVVDHNRVSLPGGGIVSTTVNLVSVAGSPNAVVKFNDFAAGGAGTSLAGFAALTLTTSNGATVKDNIFVSSVTTSGSNFMISVDLPSETGLVSNYNDVFSSNSAANAGCNAAVTPMAPSWTCGGATLDAFSIRADPEWVSMAAGSEDFHPKSTAGRFNPATGFFVIDSTLSATIDAADPAEPFAAEPAPNGFRANMGSTGGTPEASKSAPPFGTCAISRTVCKSGACPNSSIQEAVNSLPQSLPGFACVVFEDSAVYPENVSIASFTLNGSSIALFGDPAVGAHPVLQPGGGAAGFLIQTASVTLANVDIDPVAPITYGVDASSPNVALSSVNVLDPAGKITSFGVTFVRESSLSYSTVSVGDVGGILATGDWASIRYSSVTNATLSGAGYYGILMGNSAAGQVVDHVVVSALAGFGAFSLNGVAGASVTNSTFDCLGTGQNGAVYVNGGGAGNALSNDYLYNAGGPGLQVAGNVSGFSVSASTVVTGTLAGNGPLVILGGTSNSLTNVYGSGINGGLDLSGGFFNTVTGSTFSVTGGQYGLWFNTDGEDKVTRSVISNAGGDAVQFDTSAAQDTLSDSSIVSGGVQSHAVYMIGASTNTLTRDSFAANGPGGVGVYFGASSSNTLSFSTILVPAGGYGLFLTNSSTNAFTQDFFNAAASTGALLDSQSASNWFQGSTITAPGSGANSLALMLVGARGNVFDGGVISGGAWMDVGAASNTISRSTMTSAVVNVNALYLQTASSNTVSQSYLANLSGTVLALGGGTQNSQNVIRQSVIVSQSGAPAVKMSGASTNTFTSDFITNAAGLALSVVNASSNTVTLSTIASQANALSLGGGASSNTVSLSYIANVAANGAVAASVLNGDHNALSGDTFYSAGAYALTIGAAVGATPGNSLTQSVLTSTGVPLILQNASDTSVSFSTAIGSSVGGDGVWILGSASSTIVNSYVQGSTAAYVQGSTWTAIGASVLEAMQGGASGLYMGAGSAGLNLSSSVVQGGSLGAGVNLNFDNFSIPIVLSTNTILAGPQFGVYANALSVPLFVTSNTIIPIVSASTNTYGLYLGSLAGGTSVQNNSIYFRGAGATGSNVAYGIYAYGSNVQIDHNRISNPGMVTSGKYVGLMMLSSSGLVKFNDFYASGNALTSPALYEEVSAGLVTLKDNAFFNGLTNAVPYSVAVSLDAASKSNLAADYNDYGTAGIGVAAYFGSVGITHPNTLSGWASADGGDAHSISADPLYASTTPGAEDFHVHSAIAFGRFNPATQTFFAVADSSASPTIDMADPTELYTSEPNPNGLRANQGSYGDTGEASKSAPPPGCDVAYTVAQGGGADYTSIFQAITQAPGIGTSLTQNPCIVLVQAGVHAEDVPIRGITTNNHRLTIMGHPNLNPPPIIDPGGGTAAFEVQNDSVTLYRLTITPSASVPYGVYATSAALVISSVNVDAAGFITQAGVFASTGAILSASSVTVSAAYGVQLVGAGATLFASSAAASGAASAALDLDGASSATVTSFYAANGSGAAVLLSSGAHSSTIAQSTMTGGGTAALAFSGASGNTVTASVVASTSGVAADFLSSHFNTISLSSMTTSAAAAAALHVRYSSYNVVTQSLVQAGTGDGVFIDTNSQFNSVSFSTLSNAGAGTSALHLAFASTNAFSGSVAANSAGTAILVEKTSQWNTISQSTAAPGVGSPALNVLGSVGTTILGSYLSNPYTSATNVVQFQAGSDRAFISQSTITTAAPGATALVFQVAGSTVSQSVIQSLAAAPFGAVGVSLDFHAAGDVFTGDLIQGATAVVAVGATGLTLAGDDLAATTVGAALTMSTGSAALVANSTLTAPSGFGVLLSTESGDLFVGDYVQGSTAVFVTASTRTEVDASVLFATSTAGFALELTGGSAGLRMSSNVVSGGLQGVGVYVDAGDSGPLVLSTNTFPPAAANAIYAATTTAGTSLWITSNTIVLPIGPTLKTIGIGLSALAGGATVENNSVLVRQAGSSGSNAVIGIYAVSSPGLQIDHNRISDPGLITSGGFYGAAVGFSPNATFKFNDVDVAAAAGSPLTFGYVYLSSASPNSVIKDNVLFSSITLTVAGSSATLWLDPATLPGTQIDYNAYFSSTTSPTLVFGANAYQYPWSPAIGVDAHSISSAPYWASTAPGAEDFHPLSQQGRCANPPACTVFNPDSWTAGTLDAADPAEPFAPEHAPNGGRANLGSYGGTGEASQTPPTPAGAAIAAVYASSVAVSFAANGANGYGVFASTASNFTGIVISSTSNGAQPLAPQGLFANTTYFFVVKAKWGDLIVGAPPGVSTPTLAVAPAQSPSGTFPAVYTTSAAAQWLPNGNPLSVTTYTVVFSTSPSAPAGDAGDVTLSTAPAGSPDAALIGAAPPLAPNTTYYAFAAAVNWAGVPTAYTLLGATATLVAAPLSANTTFVFVASTTMSVQWTSGGNPLALTTYTVTASTASDFNAFASSVTLSTVPAAGPSATLSSLSPNTTYYLRVQAQAVNGPASAFVLLGSTLTAIEAPSSVVFDYISTGTIVAAAYVPTPAFTNLSGGLSGTNEAIFSGGVWNYQGWHGESWASLGIAPASYYGAGVAALGDYVYLVGGDNGAGPQATLYGYDVPTASWNSSLAGVSPGRRTNAATDGRSLFAVGGTLNGTSVTNLVSAYDPSANLWTSRNPLPTGRESIGLAAAGPLLYAIGGDTAGNGSAPSAANELYDASADSWTARRAMTTARVGPVAGFIAGKVYVVGGANGGDLAVNEMYDPAVDAWSSRAAMPTARSNAVGAVLGGKLYVMGGGAPVLSANEEYDPAANAWTKRASLPTAVGNGQAAVWLGRVYVVDGGLAPGQTNANQRYDPGVATAFTGLTPNTLYQFKAQARNAAGTPTVETTVFSTYTLAAQPASAVSTFTGVASSSFSVSWSANGNPAATIYVLQLSTAADFNAGANTIVLSTSAPAGPSATFSGLANYTTYYARVQAVNGDNVPTAYTLLGSTATLPPSLLPPTLSSLPGIFTTSMTATWALDAGATGYQLAASTLSANPPITVWASSAPVGLTATTATVAGLQPDTTYFLFVRALGPGAISFYSAYAATSTLPALPLSAASTFSAVSYTSFTAAWNADGNPLGIATYTVVASTASDFNLWASSVVFSTVPAAGPQAAFTGLFANTTYYFAVQTIGNGGTSTPLVPLGSTTTPVADPLALPAAQTFVAVTSNSFVLAWGADSNQLAVTTYTLVASTAPDFNAWASSVTIATAPAAGPSAFVGGLSANTTYYVGIRALGVGVSSSAFVVLGATSTRADLPAAAAFTNVLSSAIGANWTAPANPAGTLYRLQTALDPLFATTVTSSFTYNLGVSTAGLSANTTYFFRVLAINNDGVATSFVALGSTSSLAAPPLSAASTFTAVGVSSMTVSWLADGNPLAITTYTVQASTDPLFGIGASSVTLTTAPAGGPTATLGGLMFGTTYYVRVAAVNNDGIPTAFTSLGSTVTALSNLVPLIVDSQAGDARWRRVNDGLYNVSFQDGSGTHLNKFAVAIATTPGQYGAFTDVVTNLSPADSFSTPWALPATVFSAMIEGATNYVTVRVYNNVPDTNTVVDAFYVLKDTTPPSVAGPVPGDSVVRSTGGTYYTIASTDTGGGLAAFQYSVSLVKGSGDASVVPWTDIAPLSGATDYATPWTVNFPALVSGVTNYVSVRAWDLAGSTTQVTDAFYVLKDTVGPTVTISSPVATTGFVSATATFSGSAVSPFGVQGTEVAVFQPSANLYWNPGAGAFNSGAPVWMPAVGISSWTLSAGVGFVDGTGYKVIARSSTTFNFYSTVYATASFVADFAAPTVGVQAPTPNSTVSSLPVLSGTAADPGASASGVADVEVRLLRLSDGLWWNWFAQSWSSLAVSTVAVGTTTWSVAPTAQLQANLLSGASYFIAVRASDNALPSNQGNFFAQGATFTYSNPTPPAAVADLAAVSGPAPGQISLSWHATGENGNSGIVLLGQYRVFYATYSAAVPSTGAAQVAFSTANVTPGATSSFNVTGLTAGGTYFLEIALQNTDGNWSPFSNQASSVATPAPLNAIEGHVVNASTQGVTAVEVDAYDVNGSLVTTAFTLADGSGSYTVGGLQPGSYKLQATWTANGVKSSVWQDGIPMGTVGVDFSLNINYALATLTGSLATLTTASSRTGTSPAALARPSLAGSYVELAQNGRTVSRVGVDPSGRWTIPGLLPGTYSVRAFTGVSFTDYQTVSLAEGQTMQIGFVFDPLPDVDVYAFPNPARYSTTFRFVTPLSPVEGVIDVFDVAGRLVKEIPGSEMVVQPDGVTYHASWDLTNSRGQAVASGVYLYLVKVKGGNNQIVKVVKKLGVVR